MTEETRPLIRVRDLALGYGAHEVLSGITLDVLPGETWYLVGANGSGKTTFLRALLGLIEPESGAIARSAPARGARVGFVPQTEQVGGTLPTTVREFVSLGFASSDVPRAERAERLSWSLERTGLADLSRRSFNALSGGQQQRTLLARALVRRPSLLVLDEPTEALDAQSEQGFLATLDQLRNADASLTMLVVTHRLELAAQRATHLALFHEGRVLAGPRDAVLEAAREGGTSSLAARLRQAAHHPHRAVEQPG